jgi:endoglucanase
MDHPGFVVETTAGRRSHCRWFGGVKPPYFRGAKVRIERWEGSKVRNSIRGKILSTRLNKRGRVESMRVLFDKPVEMGEIGTWDVPSFRKAGDVLWTRAADDLMGCTAICLAMDQISKLNASAPVRAVFTCAEEVGLVGATALAQSGLLPRSALVIVLETSKELPRARQGEGPVLRVGDIRSTFDPGVNHFLHEAAKTLAKSDKSFRYQRCLMDGGTCEASSFGLFGYRVGALALPLRNYHNMGRKKVAAERIHLGDVRGMVKLLTEAAREATKLPGRGELPAGELGGLISSLKLYKKDLLTTQRRLGLDAARRGA